MRTNSIFRNLILLTGLAACHAAHPARAEIEQHVYRIVLDDLVVSDSAQQLVVQPLHADVLLWLDRESRAPQPDTAAARRRLEQWGIDPQLAADFVRRNAQRDSISLPAGTRLRLSMDTLPPLSDVTRDSIMLFGEFGSGFERVRAAYPGAHLVVGLSRVGISADRRRAAVYVETHCGLLCAGGILVLLEHVAGRWSIADRQPLWVS